VLEVRDDRVLIRDDHTQRIRIHVMLPPHKVDGPLIVTAFDGDWGLSPEQALAFCGAVCGLAIKAKDRASRVTSHGARETTDKSGPVERGWRNEVVQYVPATDEEKAAALDAAIEYEDAFDVD
jgi:hypothetical protein